VLANHNYDKYIKGAIKSALEQDYPAIRLVIIDDCSTDDSWSTIHNFVFKDKPHKKDTNEFF
jgi:glycosyltransferase involved in cell wall biosynthesis